MCSFILYSMCVFRLFQPLLFAGEGCTQFLVGGGGGGVDAWPRKKGGLLSGFEGLCMVADYSLSSFPLFTVYFRICFYITTV